MEEAAGRAAGEAPGEAPPPPAGDQPQPAAQGAKFRLGEDLELTESEIRDMVTRGMVGTDASIAAARAAEVAKLGSAGPARIDNLMRVMDGNGLGVVKSSLVTAKQVEALEAFFARLETQGVGSFSQRHRVSPADDTKIAGYDSMSFEQRRLAQDQIAARRGR